MTTRATSSFDVTGWDETPYGEPQDGAHLSRASVRKQYQGDLEAESTAELLMCRADAEDYTAGAGYVASELITGSLDGRTGTFVLQHGGLSGDGAEGTFGHVVPGTGTGELVGLRGEAEISVTEDGKHTLALDYHFAEVAKD